MDTGAGHVALACEPADRRYPPGHGSRHNGIALGRDVPTLARRSRRPGSRPGRSCRRSARPAFGLAAASTCTTTSCRGADGRPLNERRRRGRWHDAIAWLRRTTQQAILSLGPPLRAARAIRRPRRSAAPGEGATTTRWPTADREAGRLIGALGPPRPATLMIVAGDHGEAFGEHGEIAHSIFVYDTTLRVPLMLRGPGVTPRGAVVQRRRIAGRSSRRRSPR